MAELKVKVLQTQDVSPQLEEAFEALVKNEFDPKWVTPEECVLVSERDPLAIYVIDPFEGIAYEHLKSVECRIYGPQCVLSCLLTQTSLPRIRRPIYNMAMSGILISCTNVEKILREDIHEKVRLMCGEVSKNFTKEVTHLITNEVGSKKYHVAASLKIGIMLPSWVEEVWNKSRYSPIHGGSKEIIQEFKCGIFKGYVITVSGLPDRNKLATIINKQGGIYSGEMKINECTHLVINEAKGQKYEFAKRWKICIVHSSWLFNSLESGYCQDETQYSLTGHMTSTPEKQEGSNLPNIGDVSCISNISTVNETASVRSRVLSDTTMDATRNATGVSISNIKHRAICDSSSDLDTLNLTVISSGAFLDSCKIFLTGFQGPKLEKLRKLINKAGAIRFNQIMESVSHVIVGDKPENYIEQLNTLTHRPYVVSPSWLVDSCLEGKHIPEKDYMLLDLPPPDHTSPVQKKSKLSLTRGNSLNDSKLKNDSKCLIPGPAPNHNDMDDVMSQYLPQQDVNDETMEPDNNENHDETVENLNNDSTTLADGLFSGKRFLILGFDSEPYTSLLEMIKDHGGLIMDTRSRAVADYGIVPLYGFEVNVTVKEVATNIWLDLCIENESLVPICSNELFSPIEFKQDAIPLQGCVLSISGYSGTERECLINLAQNMGALCQDYFVKRANKGLLPSTHLIVSEPEGSKYDAAVKWKLPALHKRWLYECGRTGQRCKEEDFLVENVFNPNQTKLESQLQKESTKALNQELIPHKHTVKNEQNSKQMPHTSKENKAKKQDVFGQKSSDASSHQLEVTVEQESAQGNERSDNSNKIQEKLKTDEDVCCNPGQNVLQQETSPDKNKENKKFHTPASKNDSFLKKGKKLPATSALQKRIGSAEDEWDSVGFKTPIINNRVQALKHSDISADKTPVRSSPRSKAGIDTPGKFLQPDVHYMPSFDVEDVMSALDTPGSQGARTKRTHSRKSSLPLGDMLSMHLANAVKNTAVANGEERRPISTQITQQDIPLSQPSGPLRGVIIAVSKKLSSKQSEYNNMAASLGADYRWTYDNSCTHFIFQSTRANDTSKEFKVAKEQGKYIVSPYWLATCEDQEARVDESLFPHNLNPSMQLSVMTSKKETPARSTRKPARIIQATSHVKKERSASVRTSPRKRQEQSANDGAFNSTSTTDSDEEILNACVVAEQDESHSDENKKSESLDELSKQLKSAVEATKVQKAGRRRSKRVTTLFSSSDEASSATRSRPASRQRQLLRSSSSNKPDPALVHTEPSQSVQVTWDDPTGRLEKERLGAALDRANSPTQNSESMSPVPENMQYSDVEDAQEEDNSEIVFKNPACLLAPISKSPPVARTPTPEAPSLAFPVIRSACPVQSPQPVHMLEDDPILVTKPKPVFLFSGMSPQERDNYAAIVEQLGGHLLDSLCYDATCTHLVVGSPSRNEKFLACVAKGSWILHKSYLEACDQEGGFVDEEAYEWGGPGTDTVIGSLSTPSSKLALAAHRWRVTLQQDHNRNSGRTGAFKDWSVILCCSSAKNDSFKRLLEAGGAVILHSRPPFSNLPEVTHAFIEMTKIKMEIDLKSLLKAGIPCLKPEYLASFLSDDPVPDQRDFFISEVKQLLSDENSR